MSAENFERFPDSAEMFVPMVRVLSTAGGTLANDEMEVAVAELMNLPSEMRVRLHNEDQSNARELAYRLAWARTYLKRCGVINNYKRGIWGLVPDFEGKLAENFNDAIEEVKIYAKDKGAKNPSGDFTLDMVND